MNKDEEIKQLKATIKEQGEQLRLHSVRRCGFFVIIRVIDKYFKTKV